MGFSQQLSGFGQYSPYGMNTGMQAGGMMLGAARGFGHAANAGFAAAGIGAGMGVMAAGGGMLASTGVGIPIAAAGMVAGYAGSQMYGGMEQQFGLNHALRNSFAFRNSQGGTGFNTSQMGQIGGALREMSHQFGPGGEITSFNELSGLAAKMGQMNMAQGVRDVQTFTKKFKEMTDSLKAMAKDLGTTMEGAMEFANSAKQSGIFGMKGASNFTSMARATAVSGGLAMSEVTSAANIGSQISRSIGGLGRSGAIGGMRTIGQIGTAQQMGVLSEEDIYNVTGLTGAEGRQAFATSNMARTANFLKSGRGRRMLASMADKDGNLDQGALDQFMSGNMGVPNTMAESQKHLGQVGRANFIRNEGRLRGSALEKIGGFGDAMQMMQWAKSKGIDINDMDDRSMLFAQRQLGMGRDEADQAIKMAQAMPGILARQNEDASHDKIIQRAAQRRKTQGIEGVKNRFDQAKETINGHLEKMGQDIFNEGSNQIESFLNRLAGVYVQTTTADMQKLERAIKTGGSTESTARRRALGQGAGGFGATARSRTSNFAEFSRGSGGDFGESLGADFKSGRNFAGFTGLALGETGSFLFQGESNMSKLKKQGYDLSSISKLPAGERDAALAKALGEIDSINKGSDTVNREVMRASLGQGGEWLSDAYGSGRVKGKGKEEMMSYEAELQRAAQGNNPGAKALLAQWKNAKGDPAKQASIIASSKAAQGITTGGLKADTDFGDSMSLSKFHSVGDRDLALGKALGAGKGPSVWQKAAGGAIAGLIPFVGSFMTEKTTNLVSGDAIAKQRAQGSLIATEGYQNLASDALGTGDTKGLDKLINDKHTSEAEREQYRELKALAQFNAGDKSALKSIGMSEADANKKIEQTKGMLKDQAAANIAKRKEYLIQANTDILNRMKSRGLVGEDGQMRTLSLKEAGKLGSAGSAYLNDLVSDTQLGATGVDVEGMAAKRKKAFGQMSAAELQAFAGHAAGTFEGAAAAETANIQKKLSRNAARGRGGSSSIADALGVKLSKEESGNLAGMSADDVAATLASRLNVGDNPDAKASIAEAAKLLSKKGATGADRQQAAAALQTAKGIAEEKHTKDEAEKKEKDEMSSPMYKALDDMRKTINGAFGAGGSGGTIGSKLGDVVANTKPKDGDKPSG
jgi:hypothetical protein